MKKLLLITLIGSLYAQCNPLEVAMFISEKDGWQFPYSSFYWGANDATQEIMITNPECHELLLNYEECIMDCIFLTESENDQYLGRIGCIYYTCPDGDGLIQNYEELSDRPIHLYGQYYCSEETTWNEELDVCEPNICNGDLNNDNTKNISDIILLVQDILNNDTSCED